jgi:hypothetical protein
VTLENAPQIIIQLLIILLATATLTFSRTTAGFEGVFDTHDDDGSWPAQTLFYLSVVWSLRSIHTSLFSTYLFRKEHAVGDLGKVLIYAKIFLETSSRILALLLSVGPFLGLFNLMLPHLTDTRLAYSPQLESKYGQILESSRTFTWYTGGITVTDYLNLWILFPFFHIVLVTFIKVALVPQFLDLRSSAWSTVVSLARAGIHACSSLLVPTLRWDWDALPQAVKSQQTCRENLWHNWRQVRREYLAMSVLHCIENLVMVWPALVCAWRGIRRTGTLPQLPEEERLLGLYYTVLASPVWFLLSALLQAWLFDTYNYKGHPWARLLQDAPPSKSRESTELNQTRSE